MRGATGTILIVALSGFLMGFDGSLFTGAVVFVKGQFGLGSFELGWAVVSHTLTATLSIFLAGPLADRLGRRTMLRIAALVFAASAAVAAAAANFPMLIVARMLSGLGVGAVLVAAPMYIAEIAPAAVRGRMVTFNQLFIVIGIFLAFSSNYFVVRMDDVQPDASWRVMLDMGVLPALIYLAALFAVPESPRWHAMHGRFEAARRILARAHGPRLAEVELAGIQASMTQRGGSDARLRDLLAPQLRRVLVIGLVLGVVQQITGINSVLAYATVIFKSAGDGANDSVFVQTMLVGLVNLVFTVVALLLIDRVGRRPLMLFGTAGIAVSLLFTAYGFAAGGGANSTQVLAGLLSFVACFAMSLGPGMWVLFSEIFPNRVRGVAISFVGLVNSTVCVVVQFLFPWQMERFGGGGTFLGYALFAVLGGVLLARLLPETRGRSLEELEKSLAPRSRLRPTAGGPQPP